MFSRHSLKVPGTLAFFSLPFSYNPDKPSFEGSVTSDEYNAANPMNKYGMEGLRRMWSIGPSGDFSHELRAAGMAGVTSGMIGGFYGVFKYGREAHLRFLENNLHVKYANDIDAKRLLVDKMAVSAFQGFALYGTKIALFTMTYTALASSVAVYRGKTGILDFTIGGTMAGGVFTFWQGPRALVVGLGTGAVLGSCFGGFFYLMMLALGKSFEDIQKWQYQVVEERERHLRHESPPDWQEHGPNALLVARKYDESKDLFKAVPTRESGTNVLLSMKKNAEAKDDLQEPDSKK